MRKTTGGQREKRKEKRRLGFIALCLAVICACLLSAGCAAPSMETSPIETPPIETPSTENVPSEEIVTEDVVLENSGGSYTKAQIVIPANYEETKLPLVTLSHGFRGSMDSAGGNYLAESLAKAGIATIRMDFARCTDAAGKNQVNQYTVDTMVSDQLSAIEYMIGRYNVDPQRIGLYGRSLGGRVAMTMANENKGGYDFKALALVAPAGNGNALQYYMGGQDKWSAMKAEAVEKGSVVHQKVILTPEFFTSIEDYVPSENGSKFQHPVLVIYNTEDYVVLPQTSLECAESYSDVKITKITSSKSPHGCEMGFQSSRIKDRLLKEITAFFKENL